MVPIPSAGIAQIIINDELAQNIMRSSEDHFIYNPQKKHLFIFGILWVVSVGLIILAATDLFRENPFTFDHVLMGFLVAGSTIATAILFKNYFAD